MNFEMNLKLLYFLCVDYAFFLLGSLHKGTPTKGQNGSDNVESIDMEMSEDSDDLADVDNHQNQGISVFVGHPPYICIFCLLSYFR